MCRFTALLALIFGLASACFASDYEDLITDLARFDALSASFTQTVTYDNGQSGPSASGEMKLQRPKMFYWHLVAPSEQIVVADGQYLWVYDPDLEQVVRRNQSQHDAIPAMLLSGRLGEMKDLVSVQKVIKSRVTHYHVTILEPEEQQQHIEISFADNQLISMTIHNALGQANHFSFSDVKSYRSLDKHWFEFSAPKGVDVMLEN